MDRTEEGHLRQILLKYGKNVIKRLEIIKQNRCNTWAMLYIVKGVKQ